MTLSAADLLAIWLTTKLAAVTTIILLVIGVPLAWWLARSRSWLRHPANAIIALPIALPPTVLGFYLLVFLGPQGAGGAFTHSLGLGTLPFTFTGLVIGSVIYSLPFVVQPIQNAFATMGERPLEVAATLRASPWDSFRSVALPIARPALLTAAALGFAHTVGEFGVVLMVGGAIPGQTKVLSIALYDHVETMDYANAHALALIMVVFAFLMLLPLYLLNRRTRSA
jgi:molybdate transport system permease protein